MSRWSQAVELSWVTAGRGEEVVWWPFWGFSQNKCPRKMWLPSFDLFDLCHPLDLWPQPIVNTPPPPRPSPASALLDNTPSIWRWRTTHTCTVKQLLSGEGLSSLYLLWVPKHLLFFCLLFHFFIQNQGAFVLYYLLRPSKLGWEVTGRGSCVTFQLQG